MHSQFARLKYQLSIEDPHQVASRMVGELATESERIRFVQLLTKRLADLDSADESRMKDFIASFEKLAALAN